MALEHIAVIGASLAGTTAIETLRESGFEGRLTLLDGATELPTDRPPLSKGVLAGTTEPDRAALPAASTLGDLDIDLRLGERATGLDVAARTVTTDRGALSADAVLIATGASPRRLDSALAGVHALRTMADCLAIRADLDAGPNRVVVVGAGFIGAEVAATCRARGHRVTMIETQDLPMQRVLPGAIGRFVAELHRDEGVDVRLGVGIEAVEGGDRVERVRLTDGTVLDAEVVVAGIGVTPETGWLLDSGLNVSNGVRCDASLLAAPGIAVAGDVCEWPNELYGELMRVEQWENAIEQGSHAAKRLLHGDSPDPEAFSAVPWFWSDQFDRKIQLAGRVSPTDEVLVADGSVSDRRFVALFRSGDRCTAVLGVNRPRHVVQLRMKMNRPLSWDDALAHFA